MEPLRLYIRLIGAQLRGQMQYKASFIMSMFGTFMVVFIEFGAVVVLFTRIPLLAGWTLAEVALLYGISGVAFAVAEQMASALDNFQVHIVRGTFDRVLVRPRGALFQCLTEDFPLRRFGRIAQAALVLVIAIAWLDIHWTLDRGAVLALALLSGTVIYFCIFVLGAAFCFWTVRGKEVTNIVTYGGQTLAGYPLDVFSGLMQRMFTFVVPLAFVSYEPALYLLGKPDTLGLPDLARLSSPLAAVLTSLVAWVGWRQGIRHYQSTGS